MTSPDRPCSPADVPDLTLAEFYLARLDEDERDARAVLASPPSGNTDGVWTAGVAGGAEYDQEIVYTFSDRSGGFQAETPEQAEHITRHDPARVLRDVAAQRQIVGLLHHEPEVGIRAGTDHYVSCVCGWEQAIPNGLDWDFPYLEHLSVRHVSADPTVANAVLRLLAEVYADHPDYRADEWRPES